MTTTAIATEIRWMVEHTIDNAIEALRVWEIEMAHPLTDEQFDEVIHLVRG